MDEMHVFKINGDDDDPESLNYFFNAGCRPCVQTSNYFITESPEFKLYLFGSVPKNAKR